MLGSLFKKNRRPAASPGSMPPQVVGAAAGSPLAAGASGAPANLEHHKSVVSHFNQLLKAGYNQALVQAQWQQYYDQLGPDDKLLVSQLMQNPQPATVDPPPPAAAPPPKPVESTENYVPRPAAEQVDYNNFQEQDPTSSDPRSLNRFFGASVALDKYNAWSLAKQKKVIPSSFSSAALAAPAVPLPGAVSAPPPPPPPSAAAPPPAMPSANLGHKARNVLYWNSNTALFDEKESKSIMHQNYKSILFGLTFGAIMMVGWQFAFLNERFIRPFINPAAKSDVQILIPPEPQRVEDPTFRLLIPALGVNAVVYDQLDVREDSEDFDDFERRVQRALLQGVLHYPTSHQPGQAGDNFNSNIVIMGHSSGISRAGDTDTTRKYKFIFAELNELDVGDVIQINHKQKQYVYTIYRREIVDPNEVEVLRSGSDNPFLEENGSLTLITCEPPGTIRKRLVLLAEQTLPSPSENTRVKAGSTTGGDAEDFVPGQTPRYIN